MTDHLQQQIPFPSTRVRAKVIRRIIKIDTQQDLPWLRKSWMPSRRTRMSSNGNGSGFRKNMSRLKRATSSSSVSKRTPTFDASKLNQHLSWIELRSAGSQRAIGPGDRTLFFLFPTSELPTLRSASNLSKFVLLELESWVESNLSSWIANLLRKNSINIQTAEQDLKELQELMAEKRPSDTSSLQTSRTAWALHDGESLEKVVDQIAGFVDDLEKVFPVQAVCQKLAGIEIEEVEDEASLTMRKDAAGGVDAALSDAAAHVFGRTTRFKALAR